MAIAYSIQSFLTTHVAQIALALADAALKSVKEGRAVKVSEVTGAGSQSYTFDAVFDEIKKRKQEEALIPVELTRLTR